MTDTTEILTCDPPQSEETMVELHEFITRLTAATERGDIDWKIDHYSAAAKTFTFTGKPGVLSLYATRLTVEDNGRSEIDIDDTGSEGPVSRLHAEVLKRHDVKVMAFIQSFLDDLERPKEAAQEPPKQQKVDSPSIEKPKSIWQRLFKATQ